MRITAVRPTRRDHAEVRAALARVGVKLLVHERRSLAQAVADAREHGYFAKESGGYITCKCTACFGKPGSAYKDVEDE